MKPLLLTDLDDTLFQTERKMPADASRTPAAWSANGSPMSFMHTWQQDFIHWALGCMDVIPVTARGVESFQRVRLPFQHGAVCVHGAAILTPTGELDTAWHAHMQTQLAPYQQPLHDYLAHALQIGKDLGLALRGWMETAGELAAYLVVKSNTARHEELDQVLAVLRETLDLQGYYVHQNANNLAILPNPVNKRTAAAEMIQRHAQRHGRVPLLGFGDSLTDFGFMSLCDFAGMPPRSQLAQPLVIP